MKDAMDLLESMESILDDLEQQDTGGPLVLKLSYHLGNIRDEIGACKQVADTERRLTRPEGSRHNVGR